jgi:hypothetical protein
VLELKNVKGLLGNIPYFCRSPNEDWTSPTALLLCGMALKRGNEIINWIFSISLRYPGWELDFSWYFCYALLIGTVRLTYFPAGVLMLFSGP